MRAYRVFLWTIAFLASTAAVAPAWAQSGGQSLGGMLTNIGNDIYTPFSLLLTAGSLLVGLFLVATGMMRLVDLGNGREGTAKDAIYRLVGGGAIAALPYMVQAVAQTFYGTASVFSSEGVTAGDPSSCLTPSGGTVPVSCIARNVATNLAEPGIKVIGGLAFVFGLWMVASGIHKLAVSQANGNQQESKGWFARITFGALMTQIPYLASAVSGTLGYQNSVLNPSGTQFSRVSGEGLSYSSSSPISLTEMADTLSNLFIICAFFGIIAIWRGISLLKAQSEGTERQGLGAGITHILGGVMLTNIQQTICYTSRTFLGTGSGFC